jgi:TRAP-type C4-dicarboxylate transport system permease small subunit
MTASKGIRAMYRTLDMARKTLIVAIFSFIVISGAIEIVLRYTPGLRGFNWIDEIMRYLNIWLVFLAAGLAVRGNSHMVMDFFVKRIVPVRLMPFFVKLSLALIVIALLALTIISAAKVATTLNVMIQAFDVPIALFYLALPVGCLLLAFEYGLILIYGEHPFRDGAAEESK